MNKKFKLKFFSSFYKFRPMLHSFFFFFLNDEFETINLINWLLINGMEQKHIEQTMTKR